MGGEEEEAFSHGSQLMWSKYAIGVLQEYEEEKEEEEESNRFLKGRLAAIRKMHEAHKHTTS